uniref:Uncharacterized protein n=1 Tax=Anopheles stephensi TaxID=30069 RepID=A0A182YJ88_ANOST
MPLEDLPLWEGQQQHHSPSDQHFELKQLIQKILDQIAKLPELLNHSGHPLRPEEHLPYFDPKKYEQLLATAVLNKVVDDYRNPKNFTSSGDVAGKSTGPATAYGTVDINHNQLSAEGSQPGLLSKETLRQMSVTADDVHLHEGISYTAPGERRLSDTDESYLSDYIQRHKVPLPDLSDTTGSGSGAEDDDLQSLKSNATDGTWEENWLFRKRQLKTTESSIAMLVPSPTEEVKALIGDKNADEISDLSEAGSDCEGYESDGNVNAGAAVPKPALVAASSSSKDTSEGISSSSKIRDSLEEHLAPDSLVSINSLPVNEEALSEATNSQLLAEQSTQSHTNGTAGLLIDDLISMEPVADKVETTNPAITNPFLDDAFEPNNNVITDDVKLLQRTEAGDNRSATESTSNGYGDRKEIPIDRAHQQPQPQDTHTYNSPSNPVVNVADTNNTNSSSDSSGDSVADSTTGNGASADNPPVNVDGSRSTNKPECFKQPKVSQQLLLLDNLSPPDSPVQQVLSPHPIMMTITDVFDRLANSSPLTAISEELPPAMLHDVVESESLQETSLAESSLEAITEESSLPGEITQTILSPADTQKESDQQRTDGGDDQTADQDASLDTADTLIPGSIAEREHMKWRNAKPIANNPYSPDALQRRLSEKSRPTSMIEIDRLVRKEATPAAGDTGVLMDDESAPKEPTDSGTENDRSLPSVTGGVLAEKKKIGREYYINDPERLRAGGAPVKQTLGVQQQQQQQQSHSTDDEKVSHQTYYTLPTDSYIMDRFLNNTSATVGRSCSIRSIRSLPQHEPSHSGSSTAHRAASVDLGYQTKTPSAAGSDTAVDIPAHIIAQFEQETLHSDYKRDSFRARHATTRQFVLNPIFDEQSSPGPDGTGNERTAHTIPRKSVSCRRAAGTAGSQEPARTSPGPVVETVFTDLGTLRRSASSLLLGRNLDDGAQFQQKLSPDPSNGSSLYRSSSFGKQRDPSAEDIFAARPIQVTADDPILKQGTKVNYLSTAAREIYLVPLEPEPHGSLMSTSSELSSVNSPTSSTARPELDSLTYSEDSDVTRIYDLTTGEAKVVRANQTESMHDTILQILPQSTPEHSASQPVPAGTANVTSLKSQLSSSEDRPRRSPFPVKPLSPETIKFFAPKRKLSFTGSTNSLVSETAKGGAASEQGTTHVLPSMHSSLHIDYPASRTVTGCEFAIIEKDVIDVLPSVKELAKCYSGSTSDVSSMPPKPLYKPRDFIRQSSDVLNEEGMPSAGSKGQRQYSSTSSIAVRDEIREIRKLNLEAYRQSTYYPMAPGHSITARSLSKQIREHKANNVTDDHKVGQQEEEPLPAGDGGMNGEGTSEGNGDDGHTSPERPGSPVLLPGHLKSSIQFFENLRNKS